MRYQIERECWNENTYNGYVDKPYWRVRFSEGYTLGLTDSGNYWSIINGIKIPPHIIEKLKTIIEECKLQIVLKSLDDEILNKGADVSSFGDPVEWQREERGERDLI